MPSLRHLDPQDKICRLIDMNIFDACFPTSLIEEILAGRTPEYNQRGQVRTPRVRHCTPLSIMLFQLWCSCWRRMAQEQIWRQTCDGLKDLSAGHGKETMSAQALSAQRTRLGVEPFRQLFERACRPLCHEQSTPGAFYQGLRVMAIDGTLFNLPDTAANDATFGRSRNQYGKGAYPQARVVMLVECASHAVIAAALGGYRWAEAHGVQEVITSVEANMLVLGDCGIFSGVLAQEVQARGAHILCGLSSHMLPKVQTRLCDGSYLAVLHPCRTAKRRTKSKQTLRVIEYTLTDGRLGKPGRLYRLVTSLLDEQRYPASELIEWYQQRWEVEVMIRELKCVLHEQVKVLRSHTPEGVKQELYGLLLAHYGLRFWMAKAGERAGVAPRRLSCQQAFEELRRRVERVATWSVQDRKLILERMVSQMSEHLLPISRMRCNRREIKQVYNKHKPKKRGTPAPAPFAPTDTYLMFVELHVREMTPSPTPNQRSKASPPKETKSA